MANLKSCCQCQSNQVSVLNKTISEDDGIEVTVFERKLHEFEFGISVYYIDCNNYFQQHLDVCGTCQHIISIHNYKFWVEGDYQEYEMDCALCGTAEDSISILPDDPRKASLDFY